MKKFITVFLMAILTCWITLMSVSCSSDQEEAYTLGYRAFPDVPVRTSPNGFRYKILEIEGHKFIAYMSSYGYWQLSGPIDDIDE